MSDKEQIFEILEKSGVRLVGDVVQDPAQVQSYLARVAITRDSKGKQRPSNQLLNELKQSAQERGIKLIFLLFEELLSDIEAGLRATLLHSYPDLVRNVYLSQSSGGDEVWIDNKVGLDEPASKVIHLTAKTYLESFDRELVGVNLLKSLKLPSVINCLGLIKIQAPIGFSEIKSGLEQRGFQIPSDNWLSRKLDSMRKADHIIRLSTGTYLLSGKALYSLGVQKGRASSDLSRLLHLARKGR